MTTLMTLGRCEFSEAPASIDQSGPVLVIEGELACESYAELSARRAQLNGMVDNPDEDVFPATFVHTPEFDGFYAVELVQVGTTSAALVGFLAPYSVTLRRVTDGNAPLVEITWTSIRRTNDHSIAPSFHRVRRRRDQPGWQSRGTGWVDANRVTSDGFALYGMDNGVNQSNTAAHLGVADEHYPAAASIEVKGADGVWYPWTGRDQLAAAVDVRVTNGVVRFGVTSTGTLRHELWDGSAWDTFDFTLSGTRSVSTATYDTWSEPTILRNSVDTVVLRYDARPASDADYAALVGSASVTVTLHAGELWAGLGVLTPGASTEIALAATTTTASTAITGGLRATSNNANGNRYVMSCPTSFTPDTTNGSITPVALASSHLQFMVAQSLGGSSATGSNTEAEIINDYIATSNVRTRIVAR